MLPGKKALQIPCPDTIGTVKGDLAVEAMPITSKEVVLICGHREDVRESVSKPAKLHSGRGDLMRLSEFEILRYNIDNDVYTKIWKADSLDVRYVRMLKKEKQIQIVQAVFNGEQQPAPVIRDIFNCAGEKCEAGLPYCVFKKDSIKYEKMLPLKADLKSWLQDEDSENRAATLFLNAASGHKKSRQILLSTTIKKMSEDGHFSNVIVGYRALLERVASVCK